MTVMARPPRLHVPAGFYHVILRGNHREPLFSNAADRRVLDQIVAEAIGQCGGKVHAFCWMTNHIHALMQVGDQPLGAIVQRVAMRYSRYRHKTLETCGHLFERRYKAKLVDADAYFLTLLRYIHLNPVAAGIVADPARYKWSSHRAFLGTESIPWLTTDFGLSLLAANRRRARAAYRRLMLPRGAEQPVDLEALSHVDDSRIIGSDRFIGSLPLPAPLRTGGVSFDEVVLAICQQFGIDVALIRSRSSMRSLTPVRLELLRQAIETRTATLTEVARFLNRDPSTLCKLAASHAPKLQ